MNKLMFVAIGAWIVICGLAYGDDGAGLEPKVEAAVSALIGNSQ
jgi:hypothetical protein